MIPKNELKERLVSRIKARNNLLDFTRFTMDDFRENWHHKLVASKLDQFAKGEIKRLIIDMPPRHTKSEFVSRRLPAYIFGINPDAKIISCSYGADLAQMMNRDVQRILDSPEYHEVFPNTSLNAENVRTTAHKNYLRNSDIFEIVDHKGIYKCAGVGGSATGYGFDYGIIDDPVKNRSEAESETYRQKLWEWYSSTFRTRRQKGAAILITMTRWHPGDLVGKVLELAKNNPKADQWEVISLPALSEDIIAPYDEREEPDKALWEGGFSKEDLLATKASLTVYDWLSLYQQRPSAASGNLFKRENFRYFTENGMYYDLKTPNGIIQVQKHSCTRFQTCDPAGTAKSHSDYFVLATWALTPASDLLLTDVFRTKIEGSDHMEFFNLHSRHDNIVALGFESVGIGKTTYQNLVRDGFPVVDLQPKGDKFTRALSAAIRLGEHRIYWKEGAHWLNDWEEELLHFPNSKNDDQVDVFSEADWMLSEGVIFNFAGYESTQDEGEGYSYSPGYNGIYDRF